MHIYPDPEGQSAGDTPKPNLALLILPLLRPQNGAEVAWWDVEPVVPGKFVCQLSAVGCCEWFPAPLVIAMHGLNRRQNSI